jgi:Cys-tRNA(Pro)/Cys-tRNA(Cys) deacylase
MGRAKGTRATLAAAAAGIEHEIHEVDAAATAATHQQTRGIALAVAELLGVDGARVFKTLIAQVEGQLAVAIVPADASLDLKAMAQALGAKHAALASQQDAERATGYVLGGISPLGQRRALPMVLDASASAHDTVFVSAGRRGLELELRPGDLVAVTGALVASIGRATTR